MEANKHGSGILCLDRMFLEKEERKLDSATDNSRITGVDDVFELKSIGVCKTRHQPSLHLINHTTRRCDRERHSTADDSMIRQGLGGSYRYA